MISLSDIQELYAGDPPEVLAHAVSKRAINEALTRLAQVRNYSLAQQLHEQNQRELRKALATVSNILSADNVVEAYLFRAEKKLADLRSMERGHTLAPKNVEPIDYENDKLRALAQFVAASDIQESQVVLGEIRFSPQPVLGEDGATKLYAQAVSSELQLVLTSSCEEDLLEALRCSRRFENLENLREAFAELISNLVGDSPSVEFYLGDAHANNSDHTLLIVAARLGVAYELAVG